VPYPEQDAATRQRVQQYFPYLAQHGVSVDLRPFVSPLLYRIKNKRGVIYTIARFVLLLYAVLLRLRDILQSGRYDLVFIHREAFPFFTPTIERFVKLRNPTIVFDFDDAIFTSPTHIPNWRDPLRDPERVKDIVRLSSLTIVGNRYLCAYAEQYNREVVMLPTVLDLTRYKVKRFEDSLPITIGWVGSWSTLGSLELLAQVFESLGRSFEIMVKVVGAENVYSFRPENAAIVHKVWNFDDEVEDLHSFDIGVMPLPDNEWERGKCGLKLLQYMAVGVPTVASPVGVNAEIIEDGKNGFLAGDSTDWIEKLGRLIQNGDLRKQIGLEGRRTVEAKYSLVKTAPCFLHLLQQSVPS
jgi:glycosyltransferase involved in cell wall biosynthesis